jgi:hypothetical protein
MKNSKLTVYEENVERTKTLQIGDMFQHGGHMGDYAVVTAIRKDLHDKKIIEYYNSENGKPNCWFLAYNILIGEIQKVKKV